MATSAKFPAKFITFARLRAAESQRYAAQKLPKVSPSRLIPYFVLVEQHCTEKQAKSAAARNSGAL